MEKQSANHRTANSQIEIPVRVGAGHLGGSTVAADWNENGGQSLAKRFGIDNRNIAQRRQFVRLGDEE